MGKYLSVCVWDYKGGELSVKQGDTLSKVVFSNKKTEIEQGLKSSAAGSGDYPNRFFTVKDGKIVMMSKDEIFAQLEKENHKFESEDEDEE